MPDEVKKYERDRNYFSSLENRHEDIATAFDKQFNDIARFINTIINPKITELIETQLYGIKKYDTDDTKLIKSTLEGEIEVSKIKGGHLEYESINLDKLEPVTPNSILAANEEGKFEPLSNSTLEGCLVISNNNDTYTIDRVRFSDFDDHSIGQEYFRKPSIACMHLPKYLLEDYNINEKELDNKNFSDNSITNNKVNNESLTEDKLTDKAKDEFINHVGINNVRNDFISNVYCPYFYRIESYNFKNLTLDRVKVANVEFYCCDFNGARFSNSNFESVRLHSYHRHYIKNVPFFKYYYYFNNSNFKNSTIELTHTYVETIDNNLCVYMELHLNNGKLNNVKINLTVDAYKSQYGSLKFYCDNVTLENVDIVSTMGFYYETINTMYCNNLKLIKNCNFTFIGINNSNLPKVQIINSIFNQGEFSYVDLSTSIITNTKFELINLHTTFFNNALLKNVEFIRCTGLDLNGIDKNSTYKIVD